MKTAFVLSCLLAPGLFFASCQRREAEASTSDQPAGVEQPAAEQQQAAVDAPLLDFQRQLLDLAFEAASKFPMYPHHKNRSRAQKIVADTALELDNPTLAVAYAPRINGWRRGEVYADYAWSCARRGVGKNLESYLQLAQGVIDEAAKAENVQEWRVDSIRIKMVRAYEEMGKNDEARKVGAQIVDGSADSVNEQWASAIADRARTMSKAVAIHEIESKDRAFIANTESLGNQNASLVLLARLHGVHFDEPEVRGPIEQRVLNTYTKVPPEIRLGAAAIVIENCIEHGDQQAARKLIGEALELIDSLTWRPRNRIPQVTRFVTLRAKAGDIDRARLELDALLQEYHEKTRDELQDMHRCEVLREIALVWHVLGETEQAVELLSQAIEEGMENPNARPRCFDFVETCAAMAKNGVEPSATLWERLREICNNLSDPW